jgi:hypothetical protein
MSRSSFHFHDFRSTFLYWFSLDSRFLAMITVVIWTGHLQPMALPFFLAGAWSARGGISLPRLARVDLAILSGHGWRSSVVGDGCFAAGVTPVMARVVHAPPPVAVWLLLALRTMLVLLVVFVCVFPCCMCVSQCLCNAQILTGLICRVEL